MLARRKHYFLILSTLGTLLIVIAIFYPSSLTLESKKAPEIEKILTLKSASEQSEELLKLLERVGPEKAQEELLYSGLPFTGETHLLVHTIGNFIYEKFGQEGLSYCKDYFLSACYHAVILNTLGDNGIGGVSEALVLCDKAGGHVVASQCAHGAGHGFVAWQDFDLLKALEMCDALGRDLKNFSYFNCYDGVFMENVWGVHSGSPSPKRWVRSDDIYYPCTDTRIPEKYLNGCWSNQATLLYQRFNHDLHQTALACDAVVNESYRETCYNNFSRQIHPLTKGSVDKVKSLCNNATGESWQNYCILTNATAYWSVGDHIIPYQICEILDGEMRSKCFTQLEALQSYN